MNAEVPNLAGIVKRTYAGFGAGGGRSRAGHTDWKFALRCDPSQKGLFSEWPQRHRPMAVRRPRPNDLPSASAISKSPSTRMEPLGLIVIFAGILSILADDSAMP